MITIIVAAYLLGGMVTGLLMSFLCRKSITLLGMVKMTLLWTLAWPYAITAAIMFSRRYSKEYVRKLTKGIRDGEPDIKKVNEATSWWFGRDKE